MKTSVALFCALLVASSVPADPYSIAIQQAKRASDQNNAEQQQIQNQDGASGSTRPGSGQAPAAANPALAATLQNITNLQTDFVMVINATGDKSDRKIALMNDFSSAAQGAKASANSVKELAKDLMTAMAGNKKLAAQQLKLAREIHAVFNSSHLTAARQQKVFDDVQKTLTDAGVSLGAAIDVVTDLKTIAAETQ
jgi:hypothetical protein